MEESKLMLDGRLEVHSDGTIYRIQPDGSKVLASQCKCGRYKTVTVRISGKQKNVYVHRLVAEAFIPNPDNKSNVGYIEGSSNHVDNLEWVDKGEHASKSWQNRRTTCQLCGNPTCAEDRICTSCKTKERYKNNAVQHEEQRKADIDEAMNEINMSILTPSEQKAVELRKKYLTYDEIGEAMGCTKQCVELWLRKSINKSLAGPKPKKMLLNQAINVKSRISRIERKKLNLETNLEAMRLELEYLNRKLEVLESGQDTLGI